MNDFHAKDLLALAALMLSFGITIFILIAAIFVPLAIAFAIVWKAVT